MKEGYKKRIFSKKRWSHGAPLGASLGSAEARVAILVGNGFNAALVGEGCALGRHFGRAVVPSRVGCSDEGTTWRKPRSGDARGLLAPYCPNDCPKVDIQDI